MTTLDMRTRTTADIRKIDVANFFESALPALIDGRAYLATDGAREFDLRPTTFITQSGSWTLSRSANTFKVSRHDNGVTAVRMDDCDFEDIINDISTMEMLTNLHRMPIDRGTKDDIHGWETVLRSLLDGRPMYTAGSIVMSDRAGRKLDLSRSFTPNDDDEEIAHFLAEAGYVHLSGWLEVDLMRAIAQDMDREFANCTPSDGSWWVKLADGTERPARIRGFASRSAAVRRV